MIYIQDTLLVDACDVCGRTRDLVEIRDDVDNRRIAQACNDCVPGRLMEEANKR